MGKQCTEYQMYICAHDKKKYRKQITKSKGHNSATTKKPDQNQTWSVNYHGKAMYHISIVYLEGRQKSEEN